MTDVVARERPVGAPPARLNRVRCTHCAMPVRRGHPTCWSCGLDPSSSIGPEAPDPDVAADRSGRRPPRKLLLLIGGLASALVVLLGCVTLLGPSGDPRGVRGLAARIRGDGWERAEVSGASAEFPGPPVHGTLPARPGLPRGAEVLSATGPGVRTELLVADVAGTSGSVPATAEGLLAAYAATAGGPMAQRAPSAPRAAGFDVLVEAPGGPVRVRVSMAGSTSYLLAVRGPTRAFERFTGSFEPAPADWVRPLAT